MKKLLMVLMLSVVSTEAMAVWEWVKTAENSKVVSWVFIETYSTKKAQSTGDVVKSSGILDLKSADESPTTYPNKYLSIRVEEEFNCRMEKARTVDMTFKAKNMGEGEAVGRQPNPTQWGIIAHPDSLQATRWQAACKKRMTGWVKLENKDMEAAGRIIYARPASISKLDSKSQMLWLIDHKESMKLPENKESLSSTMITEFDCKSKQNRPLKSLFYEGSMAWGDVVYEEEVDNQWRPVLPGMAENLWNIACGKTATASVSK